MIFDKINSDSYGIFNIKMVSNNRAQTSVAFQDINLLPIVEDEILEIDITSGNSIVKNVDLKFTMPKNGMGSMIAIKGFAGNEFFDIEMLDTFRMLDLIDPKMDVIKEDVVGDEELEEFFIVKSLPQPINIEDSVTELIDFNYDDVLAEFSNVIEKSAELKTPDEKVQDVQESGLINFKKDAYAEYITQLQEEVGLIPDKDEPVPSSNKDDKRDIKEKKFTASSYRDAYGKRAKLATSLGDGEDKIAYDLKYQCTS